MKTDVIFGICRFAGLVYYIFSVTGRLCFVSYVMSKYWWPMILLDYAIDTFYVIDYFYMIKYSQRVVPGLSESDQRYGMRRPKKNIAMASEIFLLIPFELIVFFGADTKYFFILRVTKLLRCMYFSSYWRGFSYFLDEIITSVSGQRVVFFLLAMLIAAHLGACALYAIAYGLIMKDDPVLDTMLTQSDLAEVAADGTIVLLESTSYRYLRYIYFTVGLTETVGFGDMVPRATAELIVTTFLFFIGHVLIQFMVSNFIVLMNGLDASRTKYVNQVNTLAKYASFRKLPVVLQNKITAFYEHQWQCLNGIDEKELLAEFPPNIQTRILETTVRDFFKNIKIMKSFRPRLLNSLAEDTKRYMYLPGDVIVKERSVMKGLYIVTRGEAIVKSVGENSATVITERIAVGEHFGEIALLNSYLSQSSVTAGRMICEILFLSRAHYRHTCKVHMTVEEYKWILSPATDPSGSLPSTHVVSGARNNRAMLSSRLYINQDPSTGLPLFHIGSTFRKGWDCIMLLSIILQLLAIPLLLAESFNNRLSTKRIGLLTLSFTLDVLFVVDVIFRSTCFAYSYDGVAWGSRQRIWENYRASGNFWQDVIIIFPLDFIAVGVGVKFLPILRILKVIRVRSLQYYLTEVERHMHTHAGFTMSFEARRLLIMFFALFQLSHWVGCLYQLVGDMSVYWFNYEDNWKGQERELVWLNIEYKSDYGSDIYLRSVYWALNVMTSNGNGDMAAANLVETVFCTIIMYIGCPVIATIIGNIASLMATVGQDKKDFESKILEIQRLFQAKAIPFDLQKRVYFFMDYKWDKHSGIDEAGVLQSLSPPLKESVVKFVAGTVLIRIPFFSRCHDHVLEMILGMFHPRIFLDGDCLMQEGEFGKDMFVIKSGAVDVCNGERTFTYATLGPGDYIGESCLLKVAKRMASSYAMGYCETFVLSRDDFGKVMDTYPAEGARIVNGIETVLAQKAQLNKKRKESDALSPPSPSIQSIVKLKPKPSSTKSEQFGDNSRRRSSIAKIMNAVKPALRAVVPINRNFSEFDEDEYGMELSKQTSQWGLGFLIEDGSSEGKSRKPPDDILASSTPKRVWDSLMLFVIIYVYFMVPLRFAITLNPLLYVIDYLVDAVLILDSILNWTYWPVKDSGVLLYLSQDIRRVYISKHMWKDVAARFPYDLLALTCWYVKSDQLALMMKCLRLPKLLLILRSVEMFYQLESLLRDIRFPFFYLRLCEVIVGCLTVGHWLGCGFLIFANRNYGSCVNEPNQLYESACEYRDTWLVFLIYTDKLNKYGGSEISRYLRGLNWSIPTMTLFVIGDTWPTTIDESTYVFVVLFFGVALQGFLVGNVMAILSKDPRSSYISEQAERLGLFLVECGVSSDLMQKVTNFTTLLQTAKLHAILTEESVVASLPYSLQESYNVTTRMKYLKNCPFFDFCTPGVLKKLCFHLRQELYSEGDFVISYGDVGQEMFFIEDGSVEICSEDGHTVYTTLLPGSFFGETGIVFRCVRTANAIAMSFCVMYVLSKDVLDNELRGCDFDANATVQSLARLQMMNKWRNDALTSHLTTSNDPKSKIFRTLGSLEKVEGGRWTSMLLARDTNCRFALDVVGLLIAIYYMLATPFHFSFYYGPSTTWITTDTVISWIIDALCYVECAIRLYTIRLKDERIAKSVSTLAGTTTPFDDTLYVDGLSLTYDLLGQLPIELLVLLPKIPFSSIYAFRLIRLLRVPNIFSRIGQIQYHLFRKYHITLAKQKALVCGILLAYVVANHFLTCIYFAVHRYILREAKHSYLIGYGLATFIESEGKHDICNTAIGKCYLATFYFIAGVMTSVGFGDIGPHQDQEIVLEVAIATVAAIMGALLCGTIGNMQFDRDHTGNNAFKDKIRRVQHFIEYRQLNKELSDSIYNHYKYAWAKVRNLGGKNESFLMLLSKPLASEVALALHADIFASVPLLKDWKLSVRRRIAHVMRPQLLTANSSVYEETDVGHNIFFVQSGAIDVRSAVNKEDGCEYNTALCIMLLQRKHTLLTGVSAGGDHRQGSHFGEFCLTSQAGLRLGKAIVVSTAAVYDISKSDLWEVLLTVPFDARCKLLGDIFCSVGGVTHTEQGNILDKEESEIYSQTSVSSLFKLAEKIVEAAVKTFAQTDEEGELLVRSQYSTSMQRRASLNSLDTLDTRQGTCSKITSSLSTKSKWTSALQAYHQNCEQSVSPYAQDIRDRSTRLIEATVKGMPIEENHAESEVHVDAIDDRDIMDDVEELVQLMFANFDLDGSGTLDRQELRSSLSRLGVILEWNEIDAMIATATSAQSDVVSPAEVVDAVVSEITVLHNMKTSVAALLSPRKLPPRGGSELSECANTIMEEDYPSEVAFST